MYNEYISIKYNCIYPTNILLKVSEYIKIKDPYLKDFPFIRDALGLKGTSVMRLSLGLPMFHEASSLRLFPYYK